MPTADDTTLDWVTLPNALSAARVCVLPALAWSLLADAGVASLALFALAVTSDALDGPLARRSGRASARGTLLDHGADAVFVTVIAALCAWLGHLPVVLAPLIAVAFTQYVLDSRAASGAPLRRSVLGRWNGIGYFVVTGLAVFVHHYATGTALATLAHALGWALTGSTLASIADRALYARTA